MEKKAGTYMLTVYCRNCGIELNKLEIPRGDNIDDYCKEVVGIGAWMHGEGVECHYCGCSTIPTITK